MHFTTSSIIAASQLFTVAIGAPLETEAQGAHSMTKRAAYKVFGGDGSTGHGWPAMSDWKNFNDLWNANQNTLTKSCSQFSQANNSPDEIANIKKAISQVAGETGVKDVFLLSIVMQESKGCVRAPTTNYGYDNPGLMQSFQGKNSCFNVNPCPYDKILGMIRDGAGVGLGAGLQQSLKAAGGNDAQTTYRAARIYNSGSAPSGVNLGSGIATHCYCSDVANRLIGWEDSSPSGCNEGTIGSIGGSSSSNTNTNTGTTNGSGGGGCKKTYTVKPGDGCYSTGISLADLRRLNPSINAECTNLIAGQSYCVAN